MSTPAGRFLFHSLAAVAELERDLIRERVAAGMRAARKRGRRLGRPRALDSEQLARLRALHAEGRSLRAIAAELEVGATTVARVLRQHERAA